jgi:hypothetical protein
LEAVSLPPKRKKGKRPTIEEMEEPVRLTLGSERAKSPALVDDDDDNFTCYFRFLILTFMPYIDVSHSVFNHEVLHSMFSD